jgi:hypothetical protein
MIIPHCFCYTWIEELWRFSRAGYVALALTTWRPVPSGGGLFCIPWCMDHRQDTEEGEPERSAGSPIQRQLLGHALAMREAGQTARLTDWRAATNRPRNSAPIRIFQAEDRAPSPGSRTRSWSAPNTCDLERSVAEASESLDADEPPRTLAARLLAARPRGAGRSRSQRGGRSGRGRGDRRDGR